MQELDRLRIESSELRGLEHEPPPWADLHRYETQSAEATLPEQLHNSILDLATFWSKQVPGTRSSDKAAELERDYLNTVAGAQKRWGKKFGKGRFAQEAVTRAWLIGRAEELKFRAALWGKHLTNFAPPPGQVPRFASIEIKGSDKERVSQLVLDFIRRLKHAYKGRVSASTYAGHGGGAFDGRGFSIDLWLGRIDDRGFFDPTQAVALLKAVHQAAGEVSAQWRAIYNDFSVADAVNSALRRRHVVFVGKTRADRSGRVTGLNWHGPAPLLLHFHLDLAPLVGPASVWRDARVAAGQQAAAGAVTATAATVGRQQTAAPSLPAIISTTFRGRKGYKVTAGGPLDVRLRALRKSGAFSISDDDVETLQRMSRVETGGSVATVQTYDSGVLSFGFMQYTIRHGSVQKLVARAPDAFAKFGVRLGGVYRFGDDAYPGIDGAPRPSDLNAIAWVEKFLAAALADGIVKEQAVMALEENRSLMQRAKGILGDKWSMAYMTPRARALIGEAYNNRPVVIWGSRKLGITGAIAGAAKRLEPGATEDSLVGVLVEEIRRVYRERGEGGKADRLITQILAP
jgi:hypothetical protein